jgi:hypothetical protein
MTCHTCGAETFFGIDLGNAQNEIMTEANVDDLTKNYDVWIPLLRKRFQNIQAQWQQADASACGDFNQDLTDLETRWATAHKLAIADEAGTTAAVALLPAIAIPSAMLYLYNKVVHHGTIADVNPQTLVYNSYVSAIRQGGEGAPPQTGDYSDLLSRIHDEENRLGVVPPASLAAPVVLQPSGQDIGTNILKDTNSVPKPDEMIYWAKVIAAAVIAGFTLNLLSNITANAALIRSGRKAS